MTLNKIKWQMDTYFLSSGRAEYDNVTIGDKIYFIGGIDDIGNPIDTIDCYDTTINEINTVVKLPRPIHHPAVEIVDNIIYIVGGFTFAPGDNKLRLKESARLTVFDTRSGEISEKASLPETKAAMTLIHHCGYLYAIGGQDGTFHNYRTVHRYDLKSDQWEKIADLIYPRNHLTAFSDGKYIYAVGGRYYNGVSIEIKDIVVKNYDSVEIYDPVINSWRLLPERMPLGKSSHAGAIINNRFIIIYGGEVFPKVLKDTYLFDIKSKRWILGPSLNIPRHGLGSGAIIGDKIYAIGGADKYGFGITKTSEILTITNSDLEQLFEK